MGIEGLKPRIRKEAPACFKEYPISYWRGKRWAVDASIWNYQYWKVAIKQVARATDFTRDMPDLKAAAKIYISGVVSYLSELLANSITPVIVYDGKPPQEKYEIAHQKRDKAKKKNQESFEELRTQLIAESRGGNIFAITSKKKDEIAAKYAAATNPTAEVKLLFKIAMTAMGIPQLQAIGEAEWLCSFLCRQGFVDAVYSRDTDCLPHGCPYLIHDRGWVNNSRTGRTERSGMVMTLAPLLKGVNMSHETFVDFCIMCGCDYNIKIGGIAAGGAFKLMQEHRSIDKLPATRGKTSLNRESLNHNRCREIFSVTRVPGKSQEEIYSSLCENPDYTLRIKPFKEDKEDITSPEESGDDIKDLEEAKNDIKQLMSKSKVLYKGFEHPSSEFIPVPWYEVETEPSHLGNFEAARTPAQITSENLKAATLAMDPKMLASVNALKEKARAMMSKSGMAIPESLQLRPTQPQNTGDTIMLPLIRRNTPGSGIFPCSGNAHGSGLSFATIPELDLFKNATGGSVIQLPPRPFQHTGPFQPNVTHMSPQPIPIINSNIVLLPSPTSSPIASLSIQPLNLNPVPTPTPTFASGYPIPFGSFRT